MEPRILRFLVSSERFAFNIACGFNGCELCKELCEFLVFDKLLLYFGLGLSSGSYLLETKIEERLVVGF